MQLLYVDESGNSQVNQSTTSHFVLAGVAMNAAYWKQHNSQIENIKSNHDLKGHEIHTAWLLRQYGFEKTTFDFSNLNKDQRIACANNYISTQLQSNKNNQKLNKNIRKDWKIIQHYSHLTHQERVDFVDDVCSAFSNWGHSRVFIVAVDKRTYLPKYSIYEDAFEQLISRFQTFIQNISPNDYGIVAVDNNQAQAAKLTALTNVFHATGTQYNNIPNIIDTPYFVDSKMTSMIQIADLVSYGARVHFEKGNSKLFNVYESRIDINKGKMVGLKLLK